MREVAEVDGRPQELEKERKKGERGEMAGDYSRLRAKIIPGKHDHESKEREANAGKTQWPRKQLLEHDPAKLETSIHGHDKGHCAEGSRSRVDGARETAKIIENASVSEPEKVHKGPAGDGTDSSGPNYRRGAN